MLFNSIDFAIFLPVVFTLYWFVINKNLNRQNFLILAVSYFFYGYWDWRFLSLILFSTVLDYSVGVGLSKTGKPASRKLLITLSVVVNLGFLAFFKYYNFFLENFISAFTFFGAEFKASTLKVILPVGISFYTFQTLSYSIDVYKRKIEPTRDFVAFAAFVSFFPQLVAGPIERASNLLPQFYRKRQFDYTLAVNGMKQILWGLFKKMVIADNCAQYVNMVFPHSSDYSGSSILLAAVLFAFQIYGDFSGYSDIAIGTARLFGFSLMRNFAFPYFSRDIAEFWRRWHISLSTWFRDYLYIPLGGSRGNLLFKVRNTMIIFIVSGFWHGANWTFIIWGALNALYFLPVLLSNNNRKHLDIVARGKLFPGIREALQILLTFTLTVIAWIFFRADSLHHAFECLSSIFSASLFTVPQDIPWKSVLVVIVFMAIEWLGRENEFAIEKFGISTPRLVRWSFYSTLIFAIIILKPSVVTSFIYFQF
ncbi:MAG: MBOAT family O-acyltransferase [Bacteroidota bacterium]